MNLFFYYLGFITFISSYFSGIYPKNYSFSHSNTRFIAKLESKKTNVNQGHTSVKNQLWQPVSFFRDSNPTLYHFRGNKNFLISVQKTNAVPFKRRSNLNSFFKQVEREKAIILSRTTMSDRKVSFSKIKRYKDIDLLYMEGSYLDSRKKRVFFEDWNFYHNKISLYILIHNTHPLTETEAQAAYAFIADIVKSNSFLAIGEKLIEKIKTYGK